jgi:RNA recognition motif-containing protein
MENSKLFITNLNFTTPLQKLVDLCAAIGRVKDSYRPEGKGFAFVTMSSAAEAQAVIDQLSGTVLDGRSLRIEISVPKDQRPPRPEGGSSSPPPRRPNDDSRPSTGNRSFSPPSTISPEAIPPVREVRKFDDKKKPPRKEEDFNKGAPKTPPKVEKERGGANRKRWLDDLEEDEGDDIPFVFREEEEVEKPESPEQEK